MKTIKNYYQNIEFFQKYPKDRQDVKKTFFRIQIMKHGHSLKKLGVEFFTALIPSKM